MNRSICLPTVALAGVLLFSGSLAAQESPVSLVNPEFSQDGDSDGVPDGWKTYPPGNGDSSRIGMDPAGGVLVKDLDAAGGAGLLQWIPVTAGRKYRVAAQFTGKGGCFLYLIFAPGIPAKAEQLTGTKLLEKRQWISATAEGKGEGKVEGVAPAGSTQAQVWIYSPKDNAKCELTFKGIQMTDLGEGPAAPASASGNAGTSPGAAYPHFDASSILKPGEIFTVDFETGDFSQARSLEGGKKEVVSAPEPVRRGKHAMKALMTHDQKRSEITGPRSAASGEFKYGWSLYIPKDFDGKSSFSIITQWHDWGSGKEYAPDGGPPTSMYIANDTWRFKLRFQDGDSAKTVKKEFEFGSIDPYRGKWVDFVMEVNWQSPKSGEGYLRLYRDGEQVIDYQGPTWYEDKVQGPFFKMGIYKGGAAWKGEESQNIMYFDEFRMGDKSATLKQVDPALQDSPQS
jgi:hypothetical protein